MRANIGAVGQGDIPAAGLPLIRIKAPLERPMLPELASPQVVFTSCWHFDFVLSEGLFSPALTGVGQPVSLGQQMAIGLES